jgi:hypothetical protein
MTMWPATAPMSVTPEPHLGQQLIGLRGADVDTALALRVNILERQVVALELRLLVIEIDRARPWWGARAWRACARWLSSLKERF